MAPDDTQQAPLTRVPWGLPAAFGSFLVAFAVYYVGTLAVLEAAHVSLAHPPLFWTLLAYQALVAGVALSVVLFVVIPHHVGLQALGYRVVGTRIFVSAAVAIVSIFVGIVIISDLFSTFFPGYHLQGNAAQEIGTGHHFGLLRNVIVVSWAAIEAPLAEETLFRGILYQGLRSFFLRWMPLPVSVFLGAVISGALFGLAHGELRSAPILIFMGIVLAYVFQYGRSIYASALVHGFVNALSVITLLK